MRARLRENPFATWLLDTDSLTARLRVCCGDQFSVRVTGECWAMPRLDEATLLGVDPRQVAWIREVTLCSGESDIVRARTVVPLSTLTGRGRRLMRLGSRPLGEFVFRQQGFRRGELSVGRIGEHWGRRSVLSLFGKPLLVTELFLDAVLECEKR